MSCNDGVTQSNALSNETTALLAPSGRLGPSVPQPSDNRDRRRQWRVIILLFFIVFSIDVGVGVMGPAINSLMEYALCIQYLTEADRPILPGDARCKNLEIQARLARLRAWTETLSTAPELLCSLPYGMLSDKIGRKPILGLSLLGIIFSLVWNQFVLLLPTIFPVWTIVFQSIFIFIGGGYIVANAMVYSALSDVEPQESRAPLFLQLLTISLLAQFISSPIAGFLMEYSYVAALRFSTAMFIVCLAASAILPETLPASETRYNLKGHIYVELGKNIAEMRSFATSNSRIVVLALPTIFFVFGTFVQDFLLQYATRRYGWSWSEATYRLGIVSFSNLVMNVVFLPVASWICLTRLRLSPRAKDLWLSRISGVLSVIGALMIALAADAHAFSVALVILASGGGFTTFVRSILNDMVATHHVGIVNTLVGWMDGFGTMVAGPLFAETLRVGFNTGGLWLGLPFFFAAGLFTIALGILYINPSN